MSAKCSDSEIVDWHIQSGQSWKKEKRFFWWYISKMRVVLHFGRKKISNTRQIECNLLVIFLLNDFFRYMNE